MDQPKIDATLGSRAAPTGLWKRIKKPLLIGAAALAVGWIVKRARRPKNSDQKRSDSVFGTVAKSAALAAASTIPKLVMVGLARKALAKQHAQMESRHEPRTALAVIGGPSALD